MQTNKVSVDSKGNGREEALDETSRFAAYYNLDKKTAFHIRLLTEETLGMVAAITEDFDAVFWLETGSDQICRLHLTARTEMNQYKKQELLKASKSGKNAAAVGFMGKISEIIRDALFNLDEVSKYQTGYGTGPMLYDYMGAGDPGAGTTDSMVYMWSMQRYQQLLRENGEEVQQEIPQIEEAWDELEKSIVARIADDVIVGVRRHKVELIIEKKLF